MIGWTGEGFTEEGTGLKLALKDSEMLGCVGRKEVHLNCQKTQGHIPMLLPQRLP